MSRSIFGRKRSPRITIAIASVMSAIVCVSTYLLQIPIPATQGYFNIGDAMVFTSALVFGPIIGGFSGGVGSALSDMLGGYGGYAPMTLVVKGIEGALAGIISNGKNSNRDILGVIVGGAEMITGYFLIETVILGYEGLVEIPFNFLQILVGGIISVPLSLIVRRYLVPITSQTKEDE